MTGKIFAGGKRSVSAALLAATRGSSSTVSVLLNATALERGS
jgi:hypothetical protein